MGIKYRLTILIVLSSLFFGFSSHPISVVAQDSQITLRPGDFYFNVDGSQQFTFSRNIAAYNPHDYQTMLDWCVKGDTRIVRVGVDTVVMGGPGYTNSGAVIEEWSATWEQFFEDAEAQGIYVLPFFDGWFNWNAINNWGVNPLNTINGGPAIMPQELFEADSVTQTLWLQWLGSVVTRWQDHPNILAWEVYSEVNFTNGVTEENGVDFVERAAAVVREADTYDRPVTASLADVGEWPSFYQSDAVDFINFHPYPLSGQLDRYILQEVVRYRTTYNKPVLIGESGLNAATPDSEEGAITAAENARIGLEHAIWAALVSGAMNGRSFWWEDGYALYFPDLSWEFMAPYSVLEQPAARFAETIDFAGFAPLESQPTSEIIGAALGHESTVIGWYRDASSEPPDWPLQDVISGQTVIVTVPGAGSSWHIDFYNTQTGTDIISSADVAQQGDTVTISLPDFHDAIAFKMTGSGTPATTASIDLIAGTWTGIINDGATFATQIELTIEPGCALGNICGVVSTPVLSCSGALRFVDMTGDVFTFIEENMTGADYCVSGGQEVLQLQPNGELSYHYTLDNLASSGLLTRQ